MKFRKGIHNTIVRWVSPNRKQAGCLVFAFFVLAIQGFASTREGAETVYTSGKSKIVYTVSSGEPVTITEGKITATPGQSIRLLPGTHIGKGEQLAINIADKACQETIAREEAGKREETMLATIAEKQEKNLLPKARPAVYLFCHAPALPDDKTRVGQQTLSLAAVAPAPAPTCKAPVSILAYKTNIQNIHQPVVSTVQTHYPARSWGDAAETVQVMRC